MRLPTIYNADLGLYIINGNRWTLPADEIRWHCGTVWLVFQSVSSKSDSHGADLGLCISNGNRWTLPAAETRCSSRLETFASTPDCSLHACDADPGQHPALRGADRCTARAAAVLQDILARLACSNRLWCVGLCR